MLYNNDVQLLSISSPGIQENSNNDNSGEDKESLSDQSILPPPFPAYAENPRLEARDYSPPFLAE